MTNTLQLEQMSLVAKNIRFQLENYLKEYKITALVIGQSGGIDSALCSALAAPITQKLGIPLIGRSITIETNKQDEIDRGALIGHAFCSDFKDVNLTHLYTQVQASCEFEDPVHLMLDKLRMGNIKARMRMVYLYDLAQKQGGIVLSTDNYTEYLLGYWTLHGDVGDYGMIQSLWKNEVYTLAKYLIKNELKTEQEKQALQACVEATPTDGLGITDNDLQQIQADSYDEVDAILIDYLKGAKDRQNHPVIQRHLKSSYKRSNPYNLSRTDLLSSP